MQEAQGDIPEALRAVLEPRVILGMAVRVTLS